MLSAFHVSSQIVANSSESYLLLTNSSLVPSPQSWGKSKVPENYYPYL